MPTLKQIQAKLQKMYEKQMFNMEGGGAAHAARLETYQEIFAAIEKMTVEEGTG